jgi:hypothetical protein
MEPRYLETKAIEKHLAGSVTLKTFYMEQACYSLDKYNKDWELARSRLADLMAYSYKRCLPELPEPFQQLLLIAFESIDFRHLAEPFIQAADKALVPKDAVA